MFDTVPSHAPRPGLPDLADVRPRHLIEALRRGGRDLGPAAGVTLPLAAATVLGGWAMAWLTWVSGTTYWLVLATIGFPLVGPFAAVGCYEASRQIAAGRVPPDRAAVWSVVWRQSRRQLPSLCAVMVLVFLFWFFLGHMIFALFLGLAPMTNVSSGFEVWLSADGLWMLAAGSVVGAGFALLLYMITVLALPLLLDREVDFVTAMIASFVYVQGHASVMLAWGAALAGLTFLAMLPGFLGLLVVLPWLGHASWHLYALLAEEALR